MTGLVIRNADLGTGCLADIQVSGERVVAVAPEIDFKATDEVLYAGGNGVIPGLHDHHVHLYGWAASFGSVAVGPPEVRDRRRLEEAIAAADLTIPAGKWLRGVGYHESVAGALDRHALDAVLRTRPARIQHRSGSEWILNSAGLAHLPAALLASSGVERDDDGRPTGRLRRMDEQMAHVWGPRELDLQGLSGLALEWGVTAFTDATPFSDRCQLDRLGEAKRRGEITQHLTVMSEPGVRLEPPPGIRTGPVKVLLDDMTLPTFDELRAMVIDAHSCARPVAVHCVTAVQTVLTISVLADVGTMIGDRIEHGTLIAPELIPELARLGIMVVTNPGFVYERGDTYLVDVDPKERDDLYRCASLRKSGVDVLAGTDAPFGPADPWVVSKTAATRRTSGGAVLGGDESLLPSEALSLFRADPGGQGTGSTVWPGAPSDLVLLHVPLKEALGSLSSDNVAACIIGGEVALDHR